MIKLQARPAIAALLVVTAALAWPAASAATGTTAPPPVASSSSVTVANAEVRDELTQLAAAPAGGTIEVVRVGAPLPDLLQDPSFLANAHVLQRFLHDHDAGVLGGADVAVRDLVAIDVRPDGDVTVYTR